MAELITKLTASQRMEMVMKGLSPLNDEHVQNYLAGNGISNQDRAMRAKSLVGEAQNLGSSGEKEIFIDVENGRTNPEEYTRGSSQPDVRSLRKQLNEEMESYAESDADFNQEGFKSLKRRDTPKAVASNEEIMQEGFSNAKQYLNAFVTNLTESELENSYSQRLKIFKLLKVCLEAEAKYKNNSIALKFYRNGVLKAEKKMLESIQG